MKILVPTDFSKYGKFAFNTACNLIEKHEGELHLYHSADIPDDWEDLPVEEKIKDRPNKYVALEARDKLHKLKDEAVARDIKCFIHYTGGKFLENITEVLEEVPIDLIVMGSHGASGKEEWFLGTNSQKVIRKIRINTLVVKKEVQFSDDTKVVFVTSLNEEDQRAFKSFLTTMDLLKPKEVHVLTIDTSAWFTQPFIVIHEALKDFKRIASDFSCETHFYKDYSIQSGIRHFVEENDIDLIGIAYLSRNPIKRLFLGSNVEMLVNHSDAPVLCINH